MNISLKLATHLLLKMLCRMLWPSLSTKMHEMKTVALVHSDSNSRLQLLFIFYSSAKLELPPLLFLSQTMLSPFIIHAFYTVT